MVYITLRLLMMLYFSHIFMTFCFCWSVLMKKKVQTVEVWYLYSTAIMQKWSYQLRVDIHPVHRSASTKAREEGKIRGSMARCFLEHLPRPQQLEKREARKNTLSGMNFFSSQFMYSSIPKCKLYSYYACLSSFINLMRGLHFLLYTM